MPIFLSEHLPLPSLKSYTIFSLSLFVMGLLSIRSKDHDEDEDIVSSLGRNGFCAWSSVNMAYCCLFLFGKIIQRFVFGDLKAIEEQHLQESFWNYIFYKFIFVFGVINAQTVTEVMCWLAWFSMVGFWKIFGQICKDRFEFILSSPSALRKSHKKLLCLVISILSSTFCMSIAAYYSNFANNWSIFGFMLAECILLGLECLHILAKYMIQMVDLARDENWENKTTLSYYVDLFFECLIHGIDLLHHLHMLLWSNVFLSMASLVLYWNIRTIFSDLKKKLRKHQRYRKIIKNVQERFALVDEDELAQFEDNCAICWDGMKSARKLPCSHIFHQSCLCSWLQQDTSCPTCRMSLAELMDLPERSTNQPLLDGDIDQRQFAEIQARGNQRNHFFHFDGTRIANWFPSFSIEVFHGGNLDETSDQELEEMALQVHTMFPSIPYNAILDDVRRTHSSEATAENILEGNILFNSDRSELADEISNNEQTTETPSEERPSDDNKSELSRRISETSSASALETASDTSDSCTEFYEDADRRQQAFSNRRQKIYANARRRFTSMGREHSSSSQTEVLSPHLLSRTHLSNVQDQEERRARVLEAIERRSVAEQQ
ncbi:E3 ubiquitin-protein ligase AMFR-like isoform X2 [Rhopilema esculentum]|uniref:E3 ubiquitin-protein ligase AMFR-like isoform X2 n=1 Tax=Rhopilema esculentum TaxID=499914 RepID=UPI0031DAF2DB